MTDATVPAWSVWSTEWILDGTFTDRPPLEAINGRILTLDRDGHREAWKVAGGQLTEIPSRVCSLCREKPVGRGGQMCPDCRDRVAHTAATDPYGWMDEGGSET